VILVSEVEQLQFELSPNPADQFVQLNYSNLVRGRFTINILDAMGKVVLSQSDCNEKTFRISTAQLTPGLYFLKLSSAGKVGVKKFVIQHVK
jgi:hypothetical protein